MRSPAALTLLALLLVAASAPSEAQFFEAFRDLFRPVMRPFMRPMRSFFRGVNNIFSRGPFTPRARFQDDGTRRPRATGRDELFPSDCGRDANEGTGKLCFPDGLLCQRRESILSIIGHC